MDCAKMKNGRKTWTRRMRMGVCMIALWNALILLSGCGKTPQGDDVAEWNLPAEQIETWSVEESLPDTVWDDAQTGPRTERLDLFDENGTIIGHSELAYDEFDRVTCEENFDMEGNSMTRWERSYSADGREETVRIYEEDVFSQSMVILYDERGNTLEQRMFDENNEQVSVMTYDASGELAADTILLDGGMRAELIYDEQGRAIEEHGYDASGDPMYVVLHEYDEAGREIRYAMLDANGIVTNDNRTVYAEDGSVDRYETYDANGNLANYRKEELDAAGRLVRAIDYAADGTVSRYVIILYLEDGRRAKTESYNGDDVLDQFSEYNYWPDGSYRVNTYSPDWELLATEKYNADGTPAMGE